jgi:RNA polymerase sigma-70 factor, ECF subfamily
MTAREAKVIPLRPHAPPMPDDAALVVAARAGDRAACQKLFERHAQMLNDLAFRLLPWDHEAEDLVQDTFVAALTGLDRLADPRAFAPWVRSIAIRSAAKRIRKRVLLGRLGLRRSDPVDVEGLLSATTAPDVAASLRAVYRRIEALPSELRVIFVLRHVEGSTVPEIAAALGTSEGTVKRRLRDCAERLGLNAEVAS